MTPAEIPAQAPEKPAPEVDDRADRVELVAVTGRQTDVLLDALHRIPADDPRARAARTLADRLQFGTSYANDIDEFVRLTAHKKLIKAEERKTENRLEELGEAILEDFAERGSAGERHAATGKLVSPTRRIWARIAHAGDEIQPEERQRACDALQAAGLGDFVREDFNVQSLSAHFTEVAKAYVAEQLELPEDERVPLDVASLLPAECVGAIDLNDKPTLSVRG